MIAKLKEMYKDMLIEDVKTFDRNHYYFYDNETIFGISKSISHNEYNLLKKIYVEKPVYDEDKNVQDIYDYIYENKSYPFKSKKMKLFIMQAQSDDYETIINMFDSMFSKFSTINIYDYKMCFYEEKNKIDLKELVDSLSFDLGYTVKLHDAFYINEKTKGSLVKDYCELFNENNNIKAKDYSHFTDIILDVNSYKKQYVIKDIKNTIFDDYFNNQSTRDMILVMINNDLNVSTSAKLLYMNRNSLINKLDNFYKDTGINLQRFTHACAVYFLIQIK